jgi:hypothetical protein
MLVQQKDRSDPVESNAFSADIVNSIPQRTFDGNQEKAIAKKLSKSSSVAEDFMDTDHIDNPDHPDYDPHNYDDDYSDHNDFGDDASTMVMVSSSTKNPVMPSAWSPRLHRRKKEIMMKGNSKVANEIMVDCILNIQHFFQNKVVYMTMSMEINEDDSTVPESSTYQRMMKHMSKYADMPHILRDDVRRGLQPVLEVSTVKRGGASHQVPGPVFPDRAESLAVRWFVEAARRRCDKQGVTMADAMTMEALAVFGQLSQHGVRMASMKPVFSSPDQDAPGNDEQYHDSMDSASDDETRSGTKQRDQQRDQQPDEGQSSSPQGTSHETSCHSLNKLLNVHRAAKANRVNAHMREE